MLAAVAYCQDAEVCKMQKLNDRAKWVMKYAPDDALTPAEHAKLLKHDLLQHFESSPPRIKEQPVINRDERSRILRKIWTVCCFRANRQTEELAMELAAAAADRRVEHERLLRENAAKKAAHETSLAAATSMTVKKNSKNKKKRPANSIKLLETMVEAAVSVVEAAVRDSPDIPALKRLKTLL